MSLLKLKDSLVELTIPVFHIESDDDYPAYVVWTEEGPGESASYDNEIKRQNIAGTVDLFTKTELDPVQFEVQEKIAEVAQVWKLNSIQHEEGTGYHHYEWYFEVTHGKDDYTGT